MRFSCRIFICNFCLFFTCKMHMKFTRASIHWVLPSITTDFTCDVTAPTIGIIMAAAAVLLIHMDKNQVGIMRPNINLEGTGQF